eukprot:929877-Alexandrium_andersonii.AAC.1
MVAPSLLARRSESCTMALGDQHLHVSLGGPCRQAVTVKQNPTGTLQPKWLRSVCLCVCPRVCASVNLHVCASVHL